MPYFSKIFKVAVFAACSVCVDAQGLQKTSPKNSAPEVKASLLVTPETIAFSNGMSIAKSVAKRMDKEMQKRGRKSTV